MVNKEIVKTVRNFYADLLNLIWPKVCACCGNRLFRTENTICFHCLVNIPRTNYQNWIENNLHQIFWGKTEVKYATAYYYFNKHSKYRSLIHKLKYHSQPNIGIKLGMEMGYELNDSIFKNIDLIVPVPLHPKRQFKRGYNQSEMIATGLGKAMNKPINLDSLLRNIETQTQTKKNRYERFENVDSIFIVKNKAAIQNKHILLVDDVVTTGATLESCITELQKNGAKFVSVATLAIATN